MFGIVAPLRLYTLNPPNPKPLYLNLNPKPPNPKSSLIFKVLNRKVIQKLDRKLQAVEKESMPRL